MSERIDRARRSALRLTGLAVVGIAGCATDDSGGETEPDQGDGTGGQQEDETGAQPEDDTNTQGGDEAGDQSGGNSESPTARATASGGETETTDDSTTASLDLREANVTAVEVERQDGSVRFSVTLYHDDDGEDGYANWWQVESLDGERLGRRTLLHAHSTDPFTRSETVEIPDGTACVVVRGHDDTHGYGGQAVVVDLEGGETVAIDQGSESRSVSADECP